MPFIFMILELLVPMFFIFLLYKMFFGNNLNKNVNTWKTQKEERKKNYQAQPFSQLQGDFSQMYELFTKHMPFKAQMSMKAIAQDIQSLGMKAQTDNWDNLKTKPEGLREIYNFVYIEIPEIIENFIDMPKNIVHTQKNFEGQTAQEVFEDNMEIIAAATHKVTTNIFSQDLHELSVQKKYLKQKFGK